jgi:CheY-like chemotaxis protein
MDRLLVVDDDGIFHYILKVQIRKTNLFEATYIDDSALFAKYLSSLRGRPEETPDIIFLDLNMKGLNGWDMLKMIEAFYPMFSKQVSVYVTTASVDPADSTKALSYSFVRDFISKPVSTTFIEQVSVELGKRKAVAVH